MQLRLRFRLLLILMMPGLLATECLAEELAKVEVNSSAIQPRFESGTWLYLSAYYIDGGRAGIGTTREQVMATKEIDGTTCYLIRLSFDWRTLAERFLGHSLTEDDYDYFWEYYTPEGSFHFSPDSPDLDSLQSLDGFELNLPHPVEKGHRYQTSESEYVVIDDAARIQVPAGEFTCMVYQMQYLDEEADEPSRERYYMSPGVGLIRWEMDYKIDGTWVLDSRDDLVEYSL